MINSQEVLYSKGNNDECMTLLYAVKPIITLKSTAYNSTGDGTENNPYIVKDGE